jgi:hypothetical protein
MSLSGFVAFALNYDVVDTPVFVIPGFVVLWVAAAVAAERVAQSAGRARWAAVGCALAMFSIPAWNLARNFGPNDRSRDTDAMTHFDALFEALPQRTVVVREDFLVDRMVLFKLLGDRSARGRQIELTGDPRVLRSRLDAGFDVFAFPKAARRLRSDGFDASYRALPLTDGTLPEFLAHLADRTVLAIAVPGGFADRFSAEVGSAFGALDASRELVPGGGTNMVIAGVRGARRAPLARVAVNELRVIHAEP